MFCPKFIHNIKYLLFYYFKLFCFFLWIAIDFNRFLHFKFRICESVHRMKFCCKSVINLVQNLSLLRKCPPLLMSQICLKSLTMDWRYNLNTVFAYKNWMSFTNSWTTFRTIGSSSWILLLIDFLTIRANISKIITLSTDPVRFVWLCVFITFTLKQISI